MGSVAFRALESHFEQCQRREYPANATIITAGDRSSTLYYILKGSVSVILEDQDGHEMVLAYLHPGDMFGEIGMFDERRERSAWVRARSDCEVAQLGYERLRELCAREPKLIFAMLMQMSLRLRDTSRKLGDLAFEDVTGRIARALLDLCKQPDAERRGNGVAIRVTRQELGRIVGCSREMASRVLRALDERGVIRVRGKTVIVPDRSAMASRRRVT